MYVLEVVESTAERNAYCEKRKAGNRGGGAGDRGVGGSEQRGATKGTEGEISRATRYRNGNSAELPLVEMLICRDVEEVGGRRRKEVKVKGKEGLKEIKYLCSSDRYA
jgi:hypothetical protein